MRQVVQRFRDGLVEVADLPSPTCKPGHLLVQTSRTLISAGTERQLLESGQVSLFERARRQPEKVRAVLDRIGTEGLASTIEAVRNKLDQAHPLGYCNAGVVAAVGEGVTGFKVGDRVASNGQHAQVVCVPFNLCAKIPEGVTDEAAAFTVLGAIALQGIRLAQPTLGESFAVIGLGLVGLMAVQLLRAQGCRVIGLDFDRARLGLARQFGADTIDLGAESDPVPAALAFSMGRGVDGVLIAASTQSSDPLHQAAKMCRKRGRIVLIGVAGLELSRADFYEKELTFQVSCSYGPGRYDPEYEEKGRDYPLGYVRWTEQRNFEAVLETMTGHRLDVQALITHRFPIQDAPRAYEVITGEAPALGVLLEYPQEAKSESLARQRTVAVPGSRAPREGGPVIGFVGAGSHASAVLVPAFARTRSRLRAIASANGFTGTRIGRRFGFELSTTDAGAVFGDPQIDTVVIATRHDCHARYVVDGLKAGKHVFVEKPLAIRPDEIVAIEETIQSGGASGGPAPILMVGFNRRFAPHAVKVKALLEPCRDPRFFVMTVNAGAVPPGHWTLDPDSGGGRIVGEACHFIDLLRFLAGSPIVRHQVAAAGTADDCVTISLHFSDGSAGVVHYLTNGHPSFPKERLEVFCGGRILQLDDFRRLRGFGWPGFKAMKSWGQDKGHKACAEAFVSAVREGKTSPIPASELIEVARVTLAVAAAARP
jgi:predicted dehydrogenase/threonine dehydrogenase-like Zn-dependent dehydrogenase